MADNRNHRFTLRCIKAGITPVNSKIKKPFRNKSIKSYKIIHKAEKQLLYERIRNINILYMYRHNRHMYYSQLRNMVQEGPT